MFLRCRFGYQQENKQTDGLLIWRIETNGLRHLDHRGQRRLEPLDAAMGDGHAVSQACRPQTLPGKQAVSHQRTIEAMKIFEKQTRLFKNPLLAGGINVCQHLRDRQDGGKSIHDFGWIMHPTCCKREKAARKSGGFVCSVLHQSLERVVMMVLETIFVANNLAIELVHQFIDGGVQIRM